MLESMTVQDVARIQAAVAEYWSEVRHVEVPKSTNTDLLATGLPGAWPSSMDPSPSGMGSDDYRQC